MDTVLITGGSGLVGKALSKLLLSKGYNVKWLSRKENINATIPRYEWNLENKYINPKAFENVNFIVHIAGASIAGKRWTENYKREIYDSRIKTTQLLFDEVKKHNIKLKAFISASATGYYGAVTSKTILTETSPPATDFLGKVCTDWEMEATRFTKKMNIRTVQLRTAVVLSKKGGALEQMALPVRFFMGAPLGSGNQYMPFIHINDLVQIYLKAIEDNTMQGAYNATAPEQVTNKEFTKELATVLKKKLWLPPVPAFVLKIILGKMSEIILYGSKVIPKRLEDETDFEFEFSTLKMSLIDLLK